MKNEYLIHYGILGMRWGVRKDVDNAPPKQKRSRKAKPKAKTMTTKDLKTKVERMRLENDYNKYAFTKKNRAKLIGATVLTSVATTLVGLAIKEYAPAGFKAISKLRKSPVATGSATKVMDTLWDLPVSDFIKAGL